MGAEGDEEYSCSHGYKVGFPPEKGLLAEISDGVKETFFADEPLREYKGQPRSKKLWLGLQHVFPVLDWGRHYTLGKLKGDLVAGITIASLCIPQVYYYTVLLHLDLDPIPFALYIHD